MSDQSALLRMDGVGKVFAGGVTALTDRVAIALPLSPDVDVRLPDVLT